MNGLLLVDKPAGWTSHDVVGKLRRLARTKKVGHTGTLDPDATGLLPITIGVCTKLAQYLILDAKTYEFTLLFGDQTDTDDASGEVIESSVWSHVTEAAIEAALDGFRGDIMQRPPRYSALKVNGKRAYELARKGVEFELPERPVTVHSLEILSVNLPEVSMRMHCGSGTYVRSIVRDLGIALGTHAHTTSIRRTRVGDFLLEDAATIETLEAEGVEQFLLAPARMVESLPTYQASAQQVADLGFGRAIASSELFEAQQMVAIVDPQGVLIAMAQSAGMMNNQCLLKPKRVLAAN